MEMVSGAKRTRRTLEEQEDRHHEDRISSLPDGVLGDIVSFLPARDGARTQVLSSRWRHLWRCSPFHLSLETGPPLGRSSRSRSINAGVIARILYAHPGPGRRFSVPQDYFDYRDMPDEGSVDLWLRADALDGLQELEFHYASHPHRLPPWLPSSVHRFSSTLRVASFGGFTFPDRDYAGGGYASDETGRLHLPVLQQLSLTDVRISESSLSALLAGCRVLQSLLLDGRIGCSCVQIASPTLRSVVVRSSIGLQQLIIQDAPCLERLLLDSYGGICSMEITVSVISAPKLHALGPLSAQGIRLKFDTTIFQGPCSVKVLALIQVHLSLDAVIESMKCFPCLEKLYIKTKMAGEKNSWCRKYSKDLISRLDIRLKKIVLTEYRGNASHVNFAKFFVLNARMLECMRLDLYYRDPNSAWIDKQHRLLQTKNKASRDLQLDFASSHGSYFLISSEHVHDLSTSDPFS